MLKPTIALMSFVVLIASTSATGNLSNEDCFNIYYFQIENLHTGNILNYTVADLEEFSISLNITTNETRDYINNYSDMCPNQPKIPEPHKKINITSSKDKGCTNIEMNKTLVYIYDLDYSFPILKIHLGDINCGKISNFKYFFRYERTGRFDYSITGIRLWIPLFFILSLGVFLYVRLHLRANRLIKKHEKII